MALGGAILIGLLVASAYAFAWVVAQAARSEAEVAEYGDVPWIHPEMLGVAAARENDSRGGSGLHKQRPVTQTKQTQRTNPFRTGDGTN